MSTADFIQQLLKRSIKEWTTAELERQEIEAYIRQPVTPGEFDIWQGEQVWHTDATDIPCKNLRLAT